MRATGRTQAPPGGEPIGRSLGARSDARADGASDRSNQRSSDPSCNARTGRTTGWPRDRVSDPSATRHVAGHAARQLARQRPVLKSATSQSMIYSMNDPKHLDDLLARFGPKPKESFAVLRPQADLIKGLRGRGASFETIRHVLEHRGIKTCPTSIRRFCKKVLGESADQACRKPKWARKSLAHLVTGSRTSSAEPSTAQSLKPKPSDFSRQNQSPGPRIAKVEFIEEPKI